MKHRFIKKRKTQNGMAHHTKKVLKKIVSWAGLFFFALAAYMIYRQLSKYDLSDLKEALLSIPAQNLAYASLASFFGYVALSSYDFLAFKYIKKKIEVWKWIFAGFIGFSVSNNAGHAIVSGGAIRYRLYTRWRIKATEIVKMITFSGFTYLVACFFLIIVGYFITPDHAFGDGAASKVTTAVIAFLSFIGLWLYLSASLYYKKSFTIKGIKLKMPNIELALEQIFIGSLDILMASLVLYFTLIHFVDISFNTFIGAFIIAQILGVYSQVPGGLGVFELVFANIIPGAENQAMLYGALIAYRIIYYLLPLVISGIALLSYEAYLGYRQREIKKQRKIDQLKNKIFEKAEQINQKAKEISSKVHLKKK
ncbi:MAG: flippase-like domain-containing protein [Alphaproteobacteria bacterium]|nr:flippase-like domain-containing protein [Alphaproteobacteria bacterium]